MRDGNKMVRWPQPRRSFDTIGAGEVRFSPSALPHAAIWLHHLVVHLMEEAMAKGQVRSNKEKRKPKQNKDDKKK